MKYGLRIENSLRLICLVAFAACFHLGKAQNCPTPAVTTNSSCEDSLIQLQAEPGWSSYTWSPSTGLSNTTIPNPAASLSGTYTLSVYGQGPNLIFNPDFSLGNTGFYSSMNYSSIYTPGNYYIGPGYFLLPDPTLVDHTPTTDNMYISIDGGVITHTIWEQTVNNLQPNKNYYFSFWASRADQVQPIFEIHMIGNSSGDQVVATLNNIAYSGVWTWDQYSVPVWNSGSNTSVTLQLVNLETNSFGNDFGLDDFLFYDSCSASTVVNVAAIVAQAPDKTEVPNIFTPNGDGINDRFLLKGGNLEFLSCRIFNRWGLEVCNLTSENQEWNGNTFSGLPCPDGVYFYIADYRSSCSAKNGRQKGYIQLIR